MLERDSSLGQINTVPAALGVDGFLLSELNGLKVFLKDFEFAGLNRAVGGVDDATCTLHKNGVDSKTRAVLVQTGDNVPNRDGALISAIDEVARCDRLRAYFVEDRTWALPWFEERSLGYERCAREGLLLVEY